MDCLLYWKYFCNLPFVGFELKKVTAVLIERSAEQGLAGVLRHNSVRGWFAPRSSVSAKFARSLPTPPHTLLLEPLNYGPTSPSALSLYHRPPGFCHSLSRFLSFPLDRRFSYSLAFSLSIVYITIYFSSPQLAWWSRTLLISCRKHTVFI